MGLALTELHKLPGYQTAPRIWRQGVRVLDPTWVERAIRKFEATEEEEEEPASTSHLCLEWFAELHHAADFLISTPDVGDYKTATRDVRRIIADTAALHGFTYADVIGPSREALLTAARHHAIYEVSRLCLHLSLPAIGRRFGNRDHGTILNAINRWPDKARKLGILWKPSLRPSESKKRT